MNNYLNNQDISWAEAKEQQRLAEIALAEKLACEDTIFSKVILTLMLAILMASPWLVALFIQMSGGVK